MSLAQIQYFVAIAEEGTLGRAAERLHISQPPLTRQLRGLEEELGVRLFERRARGMTLLPSGAAFLERARRMLAELEAGIVAARAATPSSGAARGNEEPEDRLLSLEP